MIRLGAPHRFGVWIFLLLALGCSLPFYDQTDVIAVRTLAGDWHPFDKDVLKAAIRARFPAGSAIFEFQAFIRRLQGDCHPREKEPDLIWCEVPVRGGICWAQLLGIEVQMEAQAIVSLEVHTGGLGC